MVRRLFTSIFIFSIFFLFLFAQDGSSEIKFSIKNPEITVDEGGIGELTVFVSMPEDYHIDKAMLSFSPLKGSKYSIESIKYPPSEKVFDPITQREMEYYKSGDSFLIKIKIKGNLKEGKYAEKLKIGFQGCAGVMCFLPEERLLDFNIVVKSGVGNTFKEDTNTSSTGGRKGENRISNLFKSKGYVVGFLVIFFLGILTSFTPCVLPIIPITISVFGAKGERNKFKAFLLSVTYVMGIALTYSLLGIISVLTGSMFGQYMSNPYVMGVIGVIFFLLGLFMAGVFNFNVPASLQTKVSKVGGKGFLGAFSMGLVAGIIAAPCTGPVLGAILLYVSTTRSFILGFLMLFVYAFGLGLIFIVLGTFSSLISAMPKSGGWMDVIKSIFAVIMFLAGLYFLRNAFPAINPIGVQKPIFYLLAVILIALGIFSDSLDVDFMFANRKQKIRKSISLILITAGSFIALMNFLAPSMENNLKWIHSIDRGFSIAKREKKYVIVDFYADWCLACKELDAKTYSDEKVQKELGNFVLVKIDMTKNNEQNKKIAKKYDIKGLPLVIFFDKEGKELKDLRITGFVPPDKFLKILKKVK